MDKDVVVATPAVLAWGYTMLNDAVIILIPICTLVLLVLRIIVVYRDIKKKGSDDDV